jgi:hypothetical protein
MPVSEEMDAQLSPLPTSQKSLQLAARLGWMGVGVVIPLPALVVVGGFVVVALVVVFVVMVVAPMTPVHT